MAKISEVGGGKFSGSSTSETTFGQSVESQSQIKDTAVTTSAGEPLNIYRLEPTARADDPRWQGAPPKGIITVAARTAGDARIVASAAELDFKEIDSAPAEGVTTEHASAFRDEKLYTVVEVEHGRTDLSRGVIDGVVRTDVIKPVQV